MAVPVDALWSALLFIGLAAGGTALDRKLRRRGERLAIGLGARQIFLSLPLTQVSPSLR